ncbi:family 78 glycoside hydrolase catalytic domain [Fulvivirgaceae bacterium BMA10]|uniref:alpha-L-rhamnosidase n=1 Tax=Splendidivirga corallicola TaxID=3051826 RepID=A0ABT8KI08_9BACT|nr:family 78 glycoside hydrolase catalytic domain [Fulvivirgaceae bacterium BMA10]
MKALKTQSFLSIQIFICIIFSACGDPTGNNEVDYTDLGNASWIGVRENLPTTDSLFYLESPSPLFRKIFMAKDNIRSASLYITAAGYYRASINGKRVGKSYFDPAWTNFSKRIYYSEYDLTTEIKKGFNCLGVMLGNGFYNPLPMKMWGNLNLRDNMPSGKPIFIARLKLEYQNGQKEEIITDKSWKYHYGPIRKNNVYLGEVYNGGKEIAGWEASGFDDSSWQQVIKSNSPGGSLQKAFFPPIRITETKKPIAITALEDDKYVVDMGINFTGLYKIHLKGEPGDTVTFRFGERIYADGRLNPMTTVAGQIKKSGTGGPGAPEIAWQADQYIFGEESDTWYTPEFTFHTYRYMEIDGLNHTPTIEDIEGLMLHTNVRANNDFACSSPLVNDIQNATRQTFLSNLLSVQSDCPAREKFGYGGDLNATSEAFIYNFDMQDFYRKTIYDWEDAMNDSTFVDTAPYVGLQYCGLSWESAFLTTQYNLFLYYNDTAIIKAFYHKNLDWMAKVKHLHPEGIVKSGLSDHESLQPVPVELTGTTHYLQCARIMQKFASFMGDEGHQKEFESLANKLSTIVLEKFWRRPVTGSINKQTLFATLLYHDIIPPNEKQAAIDSLLKSIATQPSGHFNTGIFGTKYILEALSQTGNTDMVYDIVNSTEYPGWGFMIDKGATTIWETWKESDNVYSNCHPMFGSISEWFYRWLGGIRPDPNYPGFQKFIINPSVPNALSYVNTSYHSPFGKIVSNWTNSGSNDQIFEITVPQKSIAKISLPIAENQKISFLESSNGYSLTSSQKEENQINFELPSGEYVISVSGKTN